jgi:uncharacterized protein YgiM (DUF1202 family)
VTLLGRNSNSSWVRIRLSTGAEGWVNSSLVQANVAISSLPVVSGTVPPTNPVASVTVSAANVYTGPGANFGIVEVSLQGHVVALLGRTADNAWIRVRLFSGREGWISAAVIQPNVPLNSLPVASGPTAPPPPVAPSAVVKTGALNVRSGPGVGYGVVTTVGQGQTVTLLGRNSNSSWARVRVASGQEGWVNVTLIQPNVAINSLPVVETPALPATAVLITGAANVRSGPSLAFGSVAVIYQGTTVSLLGRNADTSWVKVRLSNSVEGWVNTSLLQPNVTVSSLPVLDGSTPPGSGTMAGGINVRSGPGNGYPVVASVFAGQQVSLLGRNADSTWLKIQLANGQQGWIFTSFVQSTVPINTLPVVG